MLIYTNAYKDEPAYLCALKPEIVDIVDATKDRRAYIITNQGRTIYTNENVHDFVTALDKARIGDDLVYTPKAKVLFEQGEDEPHKADKDINDDTSKAKTEPPKGRPGVNR